MDGIPSSLVIVYDSISRIIYDNEGDVDDYAELFIINVYPVDESRWPQSCTFHFLPRDVDD